MSDSKGLEYVQAKGWEFKESGTDHVCVKICPYCNNNESKFYMNVSGEARDGLFDCKKCGESGSLYMLKVAQGDSMEGVSSLREAASSKRTIPPLPDIDKLHQNLIEGDAYEDALSWIAEERGIALNVLAAMKIGAENQDGKLWIAIPHLNKEGKATYVKYRSVPPSKKEFRSSPHREVGLYNNPVIKNGMDELIFVEGEMDCLSCLSMGIDSVVGIPGANTAKAAWITKVDAAAPKKIYLLYDRDKVGQDAAKKMAQKLGMEKCFNILLPEFTKENGELGKDINEWFQAGNTLEQFKQLKAQAKPFDVNGVQDIHSVIQEIISDIDNKGTTRWDGDSPWPSLNAKLGGWCFGEVVGIIAQGKVGKTSLALNWVDYLVQRGFPSFFLCLEMPAKNLARKWISSRTQTDDTPGNSKFTKETVLAGMEIAKTLPADLLFGFCRISKPEDVFNLIRETVRRYGVRVVCMDNLQFLVRSMEHSAQETATISKKFKELAMELGIMILLIVQPNRVREGEIVNAANSMGSSAIEKDVDAMIALHRNRVGQIKQKDFNGFMDCDSNFEPQMLCRVDLSRYAPGGVCTLMMDGGTSTVREFSPNDMNGVQVAAAPHELTYEQGVASV